MKYLAGCLSKGVMIHWACWPGKTADGIDITQPSWSPYAAMAFRFEDIELAKKAALATPSAFEVKEQAVIVKEEDAFKPLNPEFYEIIEHSS